jgi:DNA-binding MarR family transcriptional regulator
MKRDQEVIEQIRSFNRYYTNVIGLLDQHFLESPFSLTEGRVLYEISNTEECSAKKIRETINIDEGYLSRILNLFKKRGLITKIPSLEDKRLNIIKLTEKGRREFASMNEHSNTLISRIIENLTRDEREEFVNMTERIRYLLSRDSQ